MTDLRIIRFEESIEGAFGILLYGKKFFCFTLQPDSADGQKFHIPDGVYDLVPYDGTKWTNTMEVIVPNHTALLFHVGNIEDHSEGCILLGEELGFLLVGRNHIRAILNSRKAYTRFQNTIVSRMRKVGIHTTIEFLTV